MKLNTLFWDSENGRKLPATDVNVVDLGGDNCAVFNLDDGPTAAITFIGPDADANFDKWVEWEANSEADETTEDYRFAIRAAILNCFML